MSAEISILYEFPCPSYFFWNYLPRTFRDKPGIKTIIKPSREAQRRHLKKAKDIIRQYRGSPQAALVQALNPVIRGWTRYYRTCSAKKIFDRMDLHLIHKLQQWAKFRHSGKSLGWRYRRYWQRRRNAMFFTDGQACLVKYATMKIAPFHPLSHPLTLQLIGRLLLTISLPSFYCYHFTTHLSRTGIPH